MKPRKSSAATARGAEHPVTVLGTAGAINSGVTPADTCSRKKAAAGGGGGRSFVAMGADKLREKGLAFVA